MFEKKFSLKHVVKNCRNLTGEFSQRELHFGVPWGLEVKKANNHLAVYLHCYRVADETNPWSIDVDFKICVTSGRGAHRPGTYQFVKAGGSGWHDLLNWGGALQLHTTNNCLKIECHVTIKSMSGFGLKRKISFEDHEDNVTDVVLKIGEKKFNVMKSLLTFRSPYFRALFFGNFSESKESEVELKDVDADDFQWFLEAIYGESVIQMENVEGVLKLADQFDVVMVREKCEELLIQTNGIGNKTKLRLADKYELEKLKSDCLQSITTAKDLKDCSPTNLTGLKPSTVLALYEKSLNFL